MPRIRVTVAVLGDLGRSPRMLYHARALADSDAEVSLVGHLEHALPADVAGHPRIRVRRLPSPAGARRHRLPRALFLPVALWNALRQGAALLAALLASRPDVVLVQTPPALPTLAVALAAARARGARLVVDWHNLGHAMLALRLGAAHPLVGLAAAAEYALGRRADAHLCVSEAMRGALATRLGGARPVVLRDRPAAAFAPAPPDVRRARRAALAERLGLPALTGRAALVVSPTSWTADEDFDLLCEAVPALDAGRLPPLVVLVTGDGPRRAEYERRFAGLERAGVHLRTLWLEPEDYPAVLAAADAGLSLHRSASGLDLAMKVADLFGAGVPVLALDYGPCLAEQVREGENGLLFRSAADLAATLARVFRGFPGETRLLDALRAGVAGMDGERWAEAWAATARPLLLPEASG
jgi:beta-1,4-mannosyltransferase